MAIRNLDFLRSMPEGTTLHEVGVRLYEALSDVQHQQQTIAQQTNSNPTGQPLPPPAIDGVTVTGQNGFHHIQIQHHGEFYRGIEYHAEYADNPAFQNPRSVPMGASREHTMFLGNGTYYWRALAAYPSSAGGPPAYHGGAHSPQPVSGGGAIGGPAFLPPQGSGTGAPGEGLSGPGRIPFRSLTGAPPIRGQSISGGGGSPGGSLNPGPMTGLPAGIGVVTAGGGSPFNPFRFVSVAQSGLAALAATLGTADANTVMAYVSDFDHFLMWTGAAWVMIGDRSNYIRGFLVDPSPGTGWQLCDGSAGITYLKSDGTTGTTTVPNLTGSPAYLKFGAAATGINAAVAPGLTMGAYTPAGTVSAPTFTGSAGTTGSASANIGTPIGTQATTVAGVGTSATGTHTHNDSGHFHSFTPVGSNSAPTFTGSAASLSGTVDNTGQPQNIVLRPWFRR